MANTRSALQEIAAHVDESMGMRVVKTNPQLGPRASAKDIGRTPLRNFGKLEIDRIVPDPSQPRKEFDDKEIQRFATSIRQTGQIHPIGVRWDEQLGSWKVVSGERRFRATKAAGLSHIDCYFVDEDMTPSEILERQLVENLMRSNLKPLEEARGYTALMELNGWNGKQVAETLRVSPSRVSRALALLDLPSDVQQRIESGELPRTTAYEITKLENERAQRDLAGNAKILTQKHAAKAVRQRRGKRATRTRGTRLTFGTEDKMNVTVTATRKCNYHEVAQALREALEEVQHRIDNNVQLF